MGGGGGQTPKIIFAQFVFSEFPFLPSTGFDGCFVQRSADPVLKRPLASGCTDKCLWLFIASTVLCMTSNFKRTYLSCHREYWCLGQSLLSPSVNTKLSLDEQKWLWFAHKGVGHRVGYWTLGCAVAIEWLLSVGLYCGDRVVTERWVVLCDRVVTERWVVLWWWSCYWALGCTVATEWLLSNGLYCDDRVVTDRWVVLCW